jgi:hypothetical protein
VTEAEAEAVAIVGVLVVADHVVEHDGHRARLDVGRIGMGCGSPFGIRLPPASTATPTDPSTVHRWIED